MQADSLAKFFLPRLLVFGLAAGLTGCSRSTSARAGGDELPSVRVQAASAESVRMAQTVPVAGIVRPQARATIAARISGVVATSELRVGGVVRQGEVVVTLQAAEYAARADQAHSALAQAEREFERERTMEAQGAATQESVREADDRRRLARAAAQEADAMLGYARIAAPFAGVVTEELVKAGDFVMPGRALFTLEGTDSLRAEVQVPEALALPAIGAPMVVVLDDQPCRGELAEVSPAADPGSRTRLAKVGIPAAAGARSGQFVRVLWPAGEAAVLTIPASAVSTLGQMERVFVIQDGRASLRLVKTAGREGDRTVINAGLEAGERVVAAPPLSLRDGQRLEIQP